MQIIPLVGETMGLSLVGAIELVADKDPGTVYTTAAVGPYLVAQAQERGLILRAMGDRIAFSPPLIISDAEISEMFDKFSEALYSTFKAVSNCDVTKNNCDKRP